VKAAIIGIRMIMDVSDWLKDRQQALISGTIVGDNYG
jgi:hypothetical protein